MAAGPARRTRVVLSGRVQGVGFRWYCRDRADERGIAGWVRNLPDGRVEAVFEGAGEDVDSLVAWCRTGPPLARVRDVERTDEAPVGESGFRIEVT